MSQLPVADYALLSDCRSAALVSRAGSVDWLCFPRFDGPSVFARLLDDAGGHWSILVPGADGTRRYVDQTKVLETTFEARSGTAVLTDAMAVGRNDLGHDLGAGSPRRAAAPGGLPGRPGGGHGRVRTATRVRAGPPAAPGGRGWPGRPRRRRRPRPVRTGRPTGGGRHREGPAGAPRGGGGLLRAAPRARLGAAAVDVYGELLGAAQRLVDQLGELDATTSGFLAAAADAAADRWMERDQGIWEIRGEPRHFLYSKLMCWWALDRAIALADRLGAGDRVVRWTAVRDEIRAAIWSTAGVTAPAPTPRRSAPTSWTRAP